MNVTCMAIVAAASAVLASSVAAQGLASSGQITTLHSPISCSGSSTDAEPLTIACSAGQGGGSSDGTAIIASNQGVLQITSQERGRANLGRGVLVTPFGAQATTDAQARDAFTISSGNRTGPGELTFAIYIGQGTEGFLQAQGNADPVATAVANRGADFATQVSIGGRTFTSSDTLRESVTSSPAGVETRSSEHTSLVDGQAAEANGWFTYRVPFTFGAPIDLEMSMHLMSFANVSAQGDALWRTRDDSDTLAWGGIRGVSADGQSINYAVSSLSGTDYRLSFGPVPEPASGALLLAGLVALAGGRRARRAARATS